MSLNECSLVDRSGAELLNEVPGTRRNPVDSAERQFSGGGSQWRIAFMIGARSRLAD